MFQVQAKHEDLHDALKLPKVGKAFLKGFKVNVHGFKRICLPTSTPLKMKLVSRWKGHVLLFIEVTPCLAYVSILVSCNCHSMSSQRSRLVRARRLKLPRQNLVRKAVFMKSYGTVRWDLRLTETIGIFVVVSFFDLTFHSCSNRVFYLIRLFWCDYHCQLQVFERTWKAGLFKADISLDKFFLIMENWTCRTFQHRLPGGVPIGKRARLTV